tara:strand:+ start:2128 stop:2298 length:171 start_codon:yes stop_codon:yes gene_type:complete
MLKKIYRKGGILTIIDDKKINDIQYGYHLIHNYDKKKSMDDYKKEYYVSKGIIYPN